MFAVGSRWAMWIGFCTTFVVFMYANLSDAGELPVGADQLLADHGVVFGILAGSLFWAKISGLFPTTRTLHRRP